MPHKLSDVARPPQASSDPARLPADVHLAHAVQLLRCAGSLQSEHQQQVTLEAVGDRIAMALKAIAERRLCARNSTPSSNYAELMT